MTRYRRRRRTWMLVVVALAAALGCFHETQAVRVYKIGKQPSRKRRLNTNEDAFYEVQSALCPSQCLGTTGNNHQVALTACSDTSPWRQIPYQNDDNTSFMLQETSSGLCLPAPPKCSFAGSPALQSLVPCNAASAAILTYEEDTQHLKDVSPTCSTATSNIVLVHDPCASASTNNRRREISWSPLVDFAGQVNGELPLWNLQQVLDTRQQQDDQDEEPPFYATKAESATHAPTLSPKTIKPLSPTGSPTQGLYDDEMTSAPTTECSPSKGKGTKGSKSKGSKSKGKGSGSPDGPSKGKGSGISDGPSKGKGSVGSDSPSKGKGSGGSDGPSKGKGSGGSGSPSKGKGSTSPDDPNGKGKGKGSKSGGSKDGPGKGKASASSDGPSNGKGQGKGSASPDGPSIGKGSKSGDGPSGKGKGKGSKSGNGSTHGPSGSTSKGSKSSSSSKGSKSSSSGPVECPSGKGGTSTKSTKSKGSSGPSKGSRGASKGGSSSTGCPFPEPPAVNGGQEFFSTFWIQIYDVDDVEEDLLEQALPTAYNELSDEDSIVMTYATIVSQSNGEIQMQATGVCENSSHCSQFTSNHEASSSSKSRAGGGGGKGRSNGLPSENALEQRLEQVYNRCASTHVNVQDMQEWSDAQAEENVQ